MVNSTEFKNREPRWPFVMHHFYVETVKAIRQVDSAFNVWKYIGDEVVFWSFVGTDVSLPDLVRRLYASMQTVRDRIHDLHGRDGIMTRHVIGVKGTAWIAAAEHVGSQELEKHFDLKDPHVCRIVEEQVSISLDEPVTDTASVAVDFIGPEIDIGFRIAKFAHDGFLILNAPLAALMLRQEVEERIPARIVSLELLKGVWGQRPYPVIWYCDPWNHREANFAYDELMQNPLVARVIAGQTTPLHHIDKILCDMNLENQVALLAQHFSH